MITGIYFANYFLWDLYVLFKMCALTLHWLTKRRCYSSELIDMYVYVVSVSMQGFWSVRMQQHEQWCMAHSSSVQDTGWWANHGSWWGGLSDESSISQWRTILREIDDVCVDADGAALCLAWPPNTWDQGQASAANHSWYKPHFQHCIHSGNCLNTSPAINNGNKKGIVMMWK